MVLRSRYLTYSMMLYSTVLQVLYNNNNTHHAVTQLLLPSEVSVETAIEGIIDSIQEILATSRGTELQIIQYHMGEKSHTSINIQHFTGTTSFAPPSPLVVLYYKYKYKYKYCTFNRTSTLQENPFNSKNGNLPSSLRISRGDRPVWCSCIVLYGRHHFGRAADTHQSG
jgi:hypothetical protein